MACVVPCIFGGVGGGFVGGRGRGGEGGEGRGRRGEDWWVKGGEGSESM